MPTHLPPQFAHTTPTPILLTQGAEALIYRTHFLLTSHPCALKYRPPKLYRHPILDARLTRHRILSEARTLVKCRREGVCVPGVLGLDWETEGGGGWMLMEWIEGRTIKDVLVESRRRWGTGDIEKWGLKVKELMMKIGRAVGKLHNVGVVHGDLTTSNLMLRPVPLNEKVGEDAGVGTTHAVVEQQAESNFGEGEIVLIDFGLATQTVQEEDKAVDLYVLERAFGSTHPEAEEGFKEVLRAYGESYKGGKVVLKRLADVRLRGRKRSMLG